MPRNRRDVDRDEKIGDIVDVAALAVRAGGYEALSFNAIAKQLGLARGALYWYFPSKDELFVAAAARVFAEALSDPPRRAGYVGRILWAVEHLAELQPLVNALHERARHSEAAAGLELATQEEMCARLRDVLRPHVAAGRLEAVAQAIVVFVQGLLAMPLSPADRDRHLRFLLDELVR